jgi:hypothetical protein
MRKDDGINVFDRLAEGVDASQVSDRRFGLRWQTTCFFQAAHERTNRMSLTKCLFDNKASDAACRTDHSYVHSLHAHDEAI